MAALDLDTTLDLFLISPNFAGRLLFRDGDAPNVIGCLSLAQTFLDEYGLGDELKFRLLPKRLPCCGAVERRSGGKSVGT
jgi:hypothetical protein